MLQLIGEKNERTYGWPTGLSALLLCGLFILTAAASVLFLSGCENQTSSSGPSPSPTAAPTASAASEDWVFGKVSENGDIEINANVLCKLTKRVFIFSGTPTVLIYHTHAAEAFRQDNDYTYTESEQWRTLDNNKNIVRVGEMLKEKLEALGLHVIHDTSNVESPSLSSAYSRSLKVMQSYEGIDIYIDVHRNAADAEKAQNDIATINGKRCARMFFVVGTGKGTYDGQFDILPDWKTNYTFALSLNTELAAIDSKLVKPIRIKADRYNQHMGLCLLVEIGTNANTMDEALNSVPYLAEALGKVISFS